jgi:hypothetical protein
MSSKPETNQIAESGLRYHRKAAGTPYGFSGGHGSMSCLRCGNHKPRSLLSPTRLAGKVHYVCSDNCGKGSEEEKKS